MQSVVPVTGDDVVVRRHAAGGIVVGHVVSVGSPARVVTARGAGAEPLDAPSPLIPGVRLGAPRDIALVGAAPAGGDVAHGVNARGLLVGAQRPGPVRRVLERAASVDEALALLDERGPELGDPIHLADAQGAATLTPGRSGPEVRRLRSADLAAAESADLFDLFQTVAAATVASAVVAHLDHSGARTVHVCLGPPCCGPFIRLWPGLEVSSAIGGSPDGPPELAVLTSALAVALEGGAVDPVEARTALDRAGAAALAEGDEAERMAALMEAPGDDRGAEVRRAVAIVHAVDVALNDLRRLLARGAGGGANL